MQQVDLYLDEFRPQHTALSWAQMVAVLMVFALLLVFYSGYVMYQEQRLQQQVAVKVAERITLESELDTLRESVPKTVSAELQMAVSATERELANRRAIKVLITQQNLGNTQGFSELMRALARQHLGKVSLTKFQFFNGGRYAELQGWSRTPEDAPFLIQRLRSESSFSKVSLGVLAIERSKDRSDAFWFTLQRPESVATGEVNSVSPRPALQLPTAVRATP